jgi:hypothetical protein
MATTQLPEHLLVEALEWIEKHGSPHMAVKAGCTIPTATLRDRVHKARALGLTTGKVVTNPDEMELRRQIKSLQSELARATEKAVTEEAIRRKIIGLSDAVTVSKPPAWMAESAKKHSSPGVPTLFASDWHAGEVVSPAQINHVNEFNMEIMRRRVRTLIETALLLLKIISPKMEYPGIVFPLGGDMISGNIHDELTATNEINTMPTVLELFGILVWAIETLADALGRVFVPCETGNHGRDTTKIWNKDRHATSFDWLLYSFLAKRFEGDKRVTFLIPDGPDAYYRIYNHRYLLTHGDQFRGGDGMIGALGPIIRGEHKKRSRNAQIDMSYDTMIIGHWHQYIHHSRVIVNGSLKGYDEYAYNNNFGYEPPQQALWITHPKNGITFRMPVFLDGVKAAPKTDWVSIAR